MKSKKANQKTPKNALQEKLKRTTKKNPPLQKKKETHNQVVLCQLGSLGVKRKLMMQEKQE